MAPLPQGAEKVTEMPGRPHHTEKMRSCVEKVMADGKTEESAYAICTTSMQKAGEPVFEAAEEGTEVRELHLLGATGKVRTEKLNDIEYFVVPVVALMEGVIHAVNADNPEFVPLATLKRAASSWNGRPLVLGHPALNGKQVSANDPKILEERSLGIIFNSRVEGMKLLQEAWFEKSRTRKLAPDVYDSLEAGKPNEVSVGAYVRVGGDPDSYQGKKYKATWLEAQGDHLAVIVRGRGACSIEMGCGTHRAAAMRVCEDHLEEVDLTVLAGARHSKTDVDMIQVMHDHAVSLGAKCQEQVVGASSNKKYKECTACEGTGNKDGNPCEMCEGKGQLKAAAESEPEVDLKAACSCHSKTKEPTMTSQKKAEAIAALIAHRHSDYKDGDEAFLETLTDARIDEMIVASDARREEADKTTRLENENRNLAAKNKVNEDKLRTAEVAPTEEEWLAKAPPGLRSLLEDQKTKSEELKNEIVSHLKTAQSEFNEEELTAMDLKGLERLARLFPKTPEEVSYRGAAAVPVGPKPITPPAQRKETPGQYAAPNSYAEGLKALAARNESQKH